ncbi:MAG: NAD-dependent epimerase/dehydratase family protein [Candidatus Falkowbacteria bacterium]
MIKILLTGGTGFIGRNLLEQLGGKYQIISPNKQELDFSDCEAVDRFFMNQQFDFVIHAANIGGVRGISHSLDTTQVNLSMFFNLVRHKEKFKKMIILGSGAEYDKSRPLSNIDEESFDQVIPSNRYGFEKYVISKFVEKYEDIICLRLFGVFGKYENYRVRFISNVLCMALLRLPIVMQQDVVFDYIFIDDLVKIIDLFITKKEYKFKFYNVGSGVPVKLSELAERINSLTGNGLPIKIINPGMGNEYTCNIKRLLEEISINSISMDESILKMKDYYEEFFLTVDTEALKYELKNSL